MKYRIFDVVKLKNGNKATILDNNKDNTYKAEIVNKEGIRQSISNITDNDITNIIFSK